MKRLALIIIAIAAISSGFVPSASADQANDTTWTDFDYVKWSAGQGFLLTVSDNTISSSDADSYCNEISITGMTTVTARKATSTWLRDYWQVLALGDTTLTAPAVVVRDSVSPSARWETTVSGSNQTHWYEATPITFTAATRIYSLTHAAYSGRYIGARAYNGPMIQSYESTCQGDS